MLVKSSHDLIAIGRLAHTLRVLVRDIEDAARALNIEPAWRLNGIAHFDATQAAYITQHLAAR